MAGGLSLLALLWPKPDAVLENQGVRSVSDLAKPPNRPVTVLVIGVDADQLKAATNKAAPPGPANADALLLLRINPGGPLQVLTLPTSLAVKLPGSGGLQSLGSLYRVGGAALTADAARELVGLPRQEPHRYLVLSRSALRTLVDELGSLEVNPNATMQYRDQRQGLTINIQSGLQRLKGAQVEQLLRYRNPARPLESRLANQEAVIRSLLNELSISSRVETLPPLVQKLRGQVESNLTPTEVLSLMAAVLGPDQTVVFAVAPLEPPRKGGTAAPNAKSTPGSADGANLRELAKSAPSPLWPEPTPAAKPGS
ncbi:LCP family protein [Cyanobium sp. NIES-981]|uniref:LCP family protein n=1 Tax=Cyanobium sp. NIES-981 TaxID=1851505 RepID=UPI0007DD31ED|nr:LCP family protein [Cyanobium sp. NIES-981]SBO42914.1 putative LytR-membrane bound transcriptional regulator [Cyanobium sp. NIES-981]